MLGEESPKPPLLLFTWIMPVPSNDIEGIIQNIKKEEGVVRGRILPPP
jgi:hypothetical protein